MCGIFGTTPFHKGELDKAQRALERMRHRGPDQYGEWFDSKVFMGHRRLSILDLSDAGRQPMMNSDEETIITVNGEIYNYQSIKADLLGEYEFRSKSDSEVILHGYSEWGLNGILDRIDGMYAFAIYDRKKKIVHLVRDRVGIKPLYYSLCDGRLTWSSEMKSILSFIDRRKLEVDNTAICDFYTYNYIPSPKTTYKNIFKLPPAHYLTIDLETLSHKLIRYWNIEDHEIKISLEEAKDKVKYLITKSVQEQMMSDVPVGFFFSGGLDSSTVVALASHVSAKLNAYTIGFNEPDSDETAYAETVAKKYNVSLQKRILGFQDAEKLIEQVLDLYDEPFGDLSAIPTFCVSKFARENVTVVLTGDGGDEVFGGYHWYTDIHENKVIASEILNRYLSFLRRYFKYRFIGRAAGKIQFMYLLNRFEKMIRYQEAFLGIEKDPIKQMLGIPKDYEDYWYFEQHFNPSLSPRKALQRMDFATYLPDDILTKVDRASMAVSLEARVPLLSREIIEFVFSLSEELIYTNDELKGLLKLVLKDLLPESIINRKKKGFSIPVAKWSRNGMFKGKPFQGFIIDNMLKKNM